MRRSDLINEILVSVLGGIFALASVFLAHPHSNWAFLTLLFTFIAWLLPTSSAHKVIGVVFVLSGLVEIILQNYSFGILWIIVAILAFLVPNSYNKD